MSDVNVNKTHALKKFPFQFNISAFLKRFEIGLQINLHFATNAIPQYYITMLKALSFK